jgi:hypothetical protein
LKIKRREKMGGHFVPNSNHERARKASIEQAIEAENPKKAELEFLASELYSGTGDWILRWRMAHRLASRINVWRPSKSDIKKLNKLLRKNEDEIVRDEIAFLVGLSAPMLD